MLCVTSGKQRAILQQQWQANTRIVADGSFCKSHTLVLCIEVWSSCDVGIIFCDFLATGSQLQCCNLTVLEHLLSFTFCFYSSSPSNDFVSTSFPLFNTYLFEIPRAVSVSYTESWLIWSMFLIMLSFCFRMCRIIINFFTFFLFNYCTDYHY